MSTVTCSAIGEFNQGVMSTVSCSYEVMGMPRGNRMRMSAAKADSRRLKQSEANGGHYQRGSACKKGDLGKHPSAVNFSGTVNFIRGLVNFICAVGSYYPNMVSVFKHFCLGA